MMQQYRRIRREVPEDTILFFRMGDFYEMFFDDAKVAAEILDITLTKRQGMPMCGVPHHASEMYLSKLIRAGQKVAICEQMEDPATAKGIVRRDITRVVTPGTILEDHVLDSKRNNYLAGIVRKDGVIGMAFIDLSTGTFWLEQTDSVSVLRDNFARYEPSECILPEEQQERVQKEGLFLPGQAGVITAYEDWTFDHDFAEDTLLRQFKVHSLDGFGCTGMSEGIRAAGAVLHYVAQQLRRPLDHVTSLKVKRAEDFMLLDESTVANLDLVEPASGRRVPGVATTLLGVLDTTKTAMGGRLLREWLLRPLVTLEGIRQRHDAVEDWTQRRKELQRIRESLGEVKDLERLISRLNAGTGNARDARALGRSLSGLPSLAEQLAVSPAARTAALSGSIHPLPELVGLLDRALVDEPPVSMKDGGIIRTGYHAELDELRVASTQGKQWLAEFQAREQERTGIKSLKVRHNKVFGYYIEISKANLDAAPEDYIRKQTLVNAERFITPELKEYENKILGAQERSIALEAELFEEVREKIVAETAVIQGSATAIAEVDVLSTLAERAMAHRYIRPVMTDGDILKVKDSRHPVMETLPQAERFVPNDAHLDGTTNQIMIITGPNMAGKSTYIRQVALLVILAQTGSFVPAKEATMGVVDRVFTRVGASDDLARGRSTFMVEMQETANILNNATARSLIVLDEIGRGTSTFDGISIAWAVAEFLHNTPAVKAKTLFATHYHELTDLAVTMSGVKNYNILVRETGETIAFLRKIVPGSAEKSFGIHVGRLAGLPQEVIGRATEILSNLEEGEFEEPGKPKLARKRSRKAPDTENQMSLFD
ncbi:MAG: DNA mismatch repair protein MutS [Verrucomicrobia bacterium]|nr:DNA mismatch repair protein MutS [Verrucomicrobiota bacterium]